MTDPKCSHEKVYNTICLAVANGEVRKWICRLCGQEGNDLLRDKKIECQHEYVAGFNLTHPLYAGMSKFRCRKCGVFK